MRPGLRRIARRTLQAVPPAFSLFNLVRAERDAERFTAALLRGGAPPLVYQMGKVGSSTVVRTLEGSDEIARPVAHVHYLEPDYVKAIRAVHVRDVGAMRVGYSWALGRALGRRFARLGDALDVDAITLVRDPIARTVSGIFQSPWIARGWNADLETADGKLDVASTVAWLLQSLERQGASGHAEKWFERELSPVLGIDVFSEPFDFSRGYQVIEGRRGRVLILRTEDLDQRLGAALQAFLGLTGAPRVVRSNVRTQQGGRDDYTDVREQLRVPLAIAQRIYGGRVVRHFYTPEEIERSIARWCGRSGVPV